jgi:hypothetical protein
MTFETEAAVCERLIADAKVGGWTAYPEQGDWDLLLVRRRVQVGVQAKLVGNLEVLLQALPAPARPSICTGPQYRAIVVGRWPGRTPKAQQDRRNQIAALAMRLRVLVLEPPLLGNGNWLRGGWPSPNIGRPLWRFGQERIDWRWYRWRTTEPVWTPPFVPDLPAGVPAPQSVSAFQIAAVRLERLGAERGWVCLDDARAVQAEVGGRWNPQTLLSRFWTCSGKRIEGSRQCQWTPHRHWPAPSKVWPAVAAGLGD